MIAFNKDKEELLSYELLFFHLAGFLVPGGYAFHLVSIHVTCVLLVLLVFTKNRCVHHIKHHRSSLLNADSLN